MTRAGALFPFLSGETDFAITHFRYAATRGLFFSHMGWIFYKPSYEKIGLIDKDDIDNDFGMPCLRAIRIYNLICVLVARLQHKHYSKPIKRPMLASVV